MGPLHVQGLFTQTVLMLTGASYSDITCLKAYSSILTDRVPSSIPGASGSNLLVLRYAMSSRVFHVDFAFMEVSASAR